MRARTGLWEPWGGNALGPPGPTQVTAFCQVQAVCATDALYVVGTIDFGGRTDARAIACSVGH